jgi:hypothetical protein
MATDRQGLQKLMAEVGLGWAGIFMVWRFLGSQVTKWYHYSTNKFCRSVPNKIHIFNGCAIGTSMFLYFLRHRLKTVLVLDLFTSL